MRGNSDDGVLDTESADDTRVYRIKLSKWFQGAFDAIQHPLFWFLLYVCRCMRGPLRHFFAFVQLESKNCNAAQLVQQLVTGKLDEFLNEYRILYDRMNDIVLKAMELSGCDSLFRDDTEGQAALSLLARKVCYQQWASFQRRICYPMKQQLSCSRVIHATILLPC